jgi:hypothetical protein
VRTRVNNQPNENKEKKMKKMKNARKEENKAISNSFSPSSTPIIAYSM